MSRLRHTRRRLGDDTRGATIVEFAFVAPLLILVIMGLSEVCYQAYATSILSGAMQKAGRDSALETGVSNAAVLDAQVLAAVRQIAKTATAVTTRRSYSTFSAIKPEDYSDTNLNGVRDPGECYTDTNNNGAWDADGGNSGQGGADDVVVYETTVTYPHLFPLGKLMGLPPTQTIKAKTVLKNQPFNNQAVPTPTVRCT